MSDRTNPEDPRRQLLDEVIGAFLVALDAGENPDPREFGRASRPSPELAEFFADREPRPRDRTVRVSPADDGSHTAPTAVDRGHSRGSSHQMSLTSRGVASEHPKAATMTSDRPLPAGIQVRYFGDYELQKVLGEGGMGIVYKARQISLNRAVALKMIKSTRFVSDDELHRFQNEAEAIARLDHPNIVPIFEVGQFEDQHYLSMKLIPGESLDRRLKDHVGDPRGQPTWWLWRPPRFITPINVAFCTAT